MTAWLILKLGPGLAPAATSNPSQGSTLSSNPGHVLQRDARLPLARENLRNYRTATITG